MFTISNNYIVTMTRGDSISSSIFINQGTLLEPVRYNLVGNDTLYFTITETNFATLPNVFDEFESAIIRKQYTSNSAKDSDGDIIISLLPSDTQNLLPGTYYYEVKLRLANGEINTIVPKTKWIIME